MPRGASPKREREYKELKSEFKKDGLYRGREEEVAARIVNQQRSRFGEPKNEKRKDREGKSPDHILPMNNYQHKTSDQVERRAIGKLSRSDLQQIEPYEKRHKNRKILLSSDDGDESSSRTKSGSTRSRQKSESSSRGLASNNGQTSRRNRHSNNVTTDHDEIRRWVEQRGGHPAAVHRTDSTGREPGILRIDYPGYSRRESLKEISWNDFFHKFEKEKLAFLYQDETPAGGCSRFSKLIAR